MGGFETKNTNPYSGQIGAMQTRIKALQSDIERLRERIKDSNLSKSNKDIYRDQIKAKQNEIKWCRDSIADMRAKSKR